MLATLRKCFVCLTPSLCWRWVGLIPLGAITASLEACGAVVVFALIKIISDPAQAATLPVVSAIYEVFPWRGGRAVICSFTVLVAFFYLAKNGLSALVAYVQYKVAGDSIAMLARRMLHGYLTAPYAFHFQRNSAELIRNTTDAVDMMCRLVMISAVNLISEVLVVTGIVIVLLVMVPVVTIIAVVVLGGVVAVLLGVTQRVFTRWGVREQELKRVVLQSLQQSLGGLKEVKVMGRERFFYETFAHQHAALVRTQFRYATLSALPRLLIETIFICGLLLVIILIATRNRIGPDLVPLLGLYAYAGFRVIPSANRLLLHLNNIRYGTAATNRVYDDFIRFDPTQGDAQTRVESEQLTFRDRLVLENLSFSYDRNSAPVLQDLSLTIHRGESLGIIGPTGAGKSTLIALILGLLQPSGGRIMVDGDDIARDLRSWQCQLGYVPQTIFLTDESLRRNIAFGLKDTDIDESKIQTAVHLAHLQECVAGLPQGLNTVLGERGIRLSGGQQQRVAIARALYHGPEVLVFDEATSALDNQTEQEVLQAIEELHGEKTLLIIAHRLSTVRACDRIVFLRQGHIAGCGSFAELMANNVDFRAMISLAVAHEVDS